MKERARFIVRLMLSLGAVDFLRWGKSFDRTADVKKASHRLAFPESQPRAKPLAWRCFVRSVGPATFSTAATLIAAVIVMGVALFTNSASFVSTAHASSVRDVPAKFRDYPYSVMSLSVGHPNAGYQVRAKMLRDTPNLVVKASSEEYRFGHPALVLMLRRSSREIANAIPGSVMLVGDVSRENGGALAGHRSHQSGRDADVGFYAVDSQGNPTHVDRFVKFGSDGKAKDGSGLRFDDYRNWLLVQSWVQDNRAGLSHIFVSRQLRARLLKYAALHKAFAPYIPLARVLLKQPERGEPHDDHFHVRISCPEKQVGLCKNESWSR